VSLSKTTLAAATAAALVLAPAAALADSHGNGHGHGHAGTHANHGKSKMHFTANGKVTAVDDASFTMHVKGGSKALHGTDVTVALADNAKVRRNGAKAVLADLQVGDRVNAGGARGEDDSLTARHVNAHGPDADDSTDDTTEAADDAGDDTATDGTVDDGTVDDGTVDDGTVDDGTTDATG
jgi:hypothetical protein